MKGKQVGNTENKKCLWVKVGFLGLGFGGFVTPKLKLHICRFMPFFSTTEHPATALAKGRHGETPPHGLSSPVKSRTRYDVLDGRSSLSERKQFQAQD